jgi:CubicO group peptidase (beta-lactamase class C family)
VETAPFPVLVILLASALLAGPAAPLPARAGEPPPAPRDVSALLAGLPAKHGVPAVGGAIVGLGGATALGAAGVREAGKEAKATAADLWHLGSCTKAMTATLCAILVEEKALRWEGSVAESFADLPRIDPGWKPATLATLLHQTAGAPPSLDADGLWGRLWSHSGSAVDQRRTLAEGVLGKPPLHAPGSRFLYANANYALAGAMAERSAKKPWEDLLRARLFRPLGMEGAGFGAPGSAAKDPDQPRGHRADGTAVPPGPGSDNPAAIGPGGTVHASLADWARFVALNLRAGKEEAPLLPPAAFARLHAPPAGVEGGYAMGWSATERPWAGSDGKPGRVLTHAGSNTMWYCVAWLAPDRGFAVLATTNRGGDAGARACDGAASVLIREHLRGK